MGGRRFGQVCYGPVLGSEDWRMVLNAEGNRIVLTDADLCGTKSMCNDDDDDIQEVVFNAIGPHIQVLFIHYSKRNHRPSYDRHMKDYTGGTAVL